MTQEELLAAVARAAERDEKTVDRGGMMLPPSIEGVVTKRLKTHFDDRGGLTPLLDLRDPFWHEPVVYAYEVVIAPGRIKGWGMHDLQADRYVVVGGNVRVVLFDGRAASPTAGALVKLYFGDRDPGLVYIPPGVWHADHNWGETKAQIINFPTRPYDPDNPDKYRIGPHSGVIPFDWTLRDG